MLHHLENFPFVLDVVDVLTLDDVLLLHCFDGHLLAFVLFQPSVLHISESTYVQY